jgi:hypothetical protein
MRFALVLGVCVILLTACNGGGDGEVPPPILIESFTVEGTSAPRNGAVPIETRVNRGRFTLRFTLAEDNDNYTASIAVSTDTEFDPDDFTDPIIARGCGKISITDGCTPDVTFHCTYTLDNANYVTTCVDDAGLSTSRDLTAFFSGRSYPTNAYLLVRACNALFTRCDTKRVLAFFN